MKIVVDADACPVTAFAVEAAAKYHLACVLVCDHTHSIEYEGAKTIIVDKGADSADLKIANLLCAGDIVITQDYGLATLCLAKKAKVLSQNGLIFTEENIDTLLFSRHVHKKAMRAGKHVKGPKKRTAENDEAFLKAFYTLLEKN